MEKCVLCGCELEGYGNNPYPLATEGRCCDVCDMRVVEARLDMARQEIAAGNLAKIVANKVIKEVCDANRESGAVGVRAVLDKYNLWDLVEGEDE